MGGSSRRGHRCKGCGVKSMRLPERGSHMGYRHEPGCKFEQSMQRSKWGKQSRGLGT